MSNSEPEVKSMVVYDFQCVLAQHLPFQSKSLPQKNRKLGQEQSFSVAAKHLTTAHRPLLSKILERVQTSGAEFHDDPQFLLDDEGRVVTDDVLVVTLTHCLDLLLQNTRHLGQYMIRL